MAIFLDKAILLYDLGRYREAEQELRKLLADNPNHVTGHALLGMALSRLGKRREALHETRTAIGIDPTDSHAFYAHAVVLVNNQQPAAARKAIREAIRLDPFNAAYYWLQGAMLFDLRRWRRALEALDRALAVSPTHVDSLNLRGRVLQKLGRHDEAREAFDQALASDPESADSHHARGSLLLARHDQSALAHLLEARRLDPIAKTDPESIALALGWQLPPFCWIAPLVPRWYAWRPKRTWALFYGLILVYLLLTLGLRHERGQASIAAVRFAVLAVNCLFLPVTFDVCAATTAKVLRRRLVGTPWHELVFQVPLVLWPFACHVGMTVLLVSVPVDFLPLMVFAIGSCTYFVAQFFRACLEARFSVVFRIAYAALLMVSSCMLALTDDFPTGEILFCAALFGVLSLFSDNVGRLIRRWEL